MNYVPFDVFAETTDNELPTILAIEEEMAAPKPTLTQRVETLERASGLRPNRTFDERARENAVTWIGLAGLAVALVGLLIAYFAWWQPQWKAAADEALVAQMDRQIDAKLIAHHWDEMSTDIAGVKARLATMQPLLEMLIQMEMQREATLPVLNLKDSCMS